MEYNHAYQQLKGKLGPNGFVMDVGSIYTPDGLQKRHAGAGGFLRQQRLY